MRPTDSFYGKYAPIFSKLFEVLYLCVTCAAPAVTVATGGATLSALTVYLNPEMSRQSVLTVFMVQNGSSLFGRQIDKFYYNIFYRTAVGRNSVERLILSEQGYREQMKNVVEPYLDIRKSVLWPEREEGKKIYCERYLADSPKGVVMISHGFTETAEKYKEVIYYFVKKQYHVYLPEYCGHGRSYRLISDSSLIHVDDYQRYVNDFLYVAKMAAKENPGLPVFLYGHSMGGGLAAAEAAQEPELFKKVVLSSPMIRPATGNILQHQPVQHHLRETSARRRRIRSPAGGSLHYIVHPQYRHPRHLRIQLHQGGAVQPCRLWRTQSALYMGQEK